MDLPVRWCHIDSDCWALVTKLSFENYNQAFRRIVGKEIVNNQQIKHTLGLFGVVLEASYQKILSLRIKQNIFKAKKLKGSALIKLIAYFYHFRSKCQRAQMTNSEFGFIDLKKI